MILPQQIAAFSQSAIAGKQMPFDVFLIAGQSNNHYGSTLDGAVDVGHARLRQWTQAAAVSSGAEPLDHVDAQANKIGYAVKFARDYYIPNLLSAARQVLLVPRAKGGTGFSANNWNPGDPEYTAAVNAALAAVAARPSGALKAILWHKGEQDQQVAMSGLNYRTALEAMLVAMRTAFGLPNLPIVVGGMTANTIGASGGAAIEYVIKNVVNRLSYTGFADSQLPSSLGASNVHFTAAEQRTMAGRYYDAYVAALTNVLSWSTAMSMTFADGDDVTGNAINNYSIRQVIPASVIPASGSRVRITFRAPAANTMTVDDVSIVERGSGADGAGAPTQVYFNAGLAGFSIANNATIVSDPLAFALDETKSYIVIFDISSSGGNQRQRQGGASLAAGYTAYYKAATDSYNSQSVSGFTTSADTVYAISQIEVSA